MKIKCEDEVHVRVSIGVDVGLHQITRIADRRAQEYLPGSGVMQCEDCNKSIIDYTSSLYYHLHNIIIIFYKFRITQA